MLTTLLPPTVGHGASSTASTSSSEADGVRRSIGVIPQAMTSDLELSVEENLIIFAKLYGVPRDKRHAADRRAARGGRADAVARQAGEEPLRRHAPPRRDRARPGARAARLLPRRADDRPRSGVARRGVGDAAARSRRERDLTVLHHDALHGRSRQALRSHRHRRSRQADGARLAAEAEGVDSRARTCSRSASRPVPDGLGTRRCQALPRRRRRHRRRPRVPHLHRATARRRRWR